MGVRSSRHQAVLKELAEWWEDISEARIGSRVVLVEVPSAGIFRRLADLRQAARAGYHARTLDSACGSAHIRPHWPGTLTGHGLRTSA